MDRTVLEIIGWVGSAILVVSLLQTNLHRLRWINLVGCVILVGYNAVLGVWPMVGLNVVENDMRLRNSLATNIDIVKACLHE